MGKAHWRYMGSPHPSHRATCTRGCLWRLQGALWPEAVRLGSWAGDPSRAGGMAASARIWQIALRIGTQGRMGQVKGCSNFKNDCVQIWPFSGNLGLWGDLKVETLPAPKTVTKPRTWEAPLLQTQLIVRKWREAEKWAAKLPLTFDCPVLRSYQRAKVFKNECVTFYNRHLEKIAHKSPALARNFAYTASADKKIKQNKREKNRLL